MSDTNRTFHRSIQGEFELDFYPVTAGWKKPFNLLTTGVAPYTGERWWASLSPRARRWFDEADVIDLQWAESLWNAPVIRRNCPAATLAGLAHDLRSESIARALGESTGKPLLEARLAHWSVSRMERKSISHLDAMMVFKGADQAHLRRSGIGIKTMIAPVPLPEPGRMPAPRPRSRRVLFAGAMYRPENAEAALWFARRVWPRVRERVPEARWRIAGAKPSSRVRDLASESVEVTGYMDDLLDAYEDVACVVVPLRRGAGVKFKSVEAVAGGFPLIATNVGAEGISDMVGRELPWVSDSSKQIAESVTWALTHSDSAIKTARELREALARQPSFEDRVKEWLSLVQGFKSR